MATLHTERLILRDWQDRDADSFARMNADPRVMEFLPSRFSRAESDQLLQRIRDHIQARGFGLFAAELIAEHSLIGFIGLSVQSFEEHFTQCVEIGWRLAAGHWGEGLATEGAREIVRYAFEDLALRELVSFTVPANRRSRRVMEKVGMAHNPEDDFEHPKLPAGHPLRRHVLYRLRASP